MSKKIGEVIKNLRQEKNLSQAAFAKIFEVAPSTVGSWENSDRIPRPEKLESIADYFNIDMDYLMGKTPIRNKYRDGSIGDYISNIHPIVIKKIPMLGSIACGEPIYADQQYEMVDMAESNVRADFCLTAQGDSMINARIYDGDIVFIQSSQEVPDGSIAAVIIDDVATLKRFYYYKDQNMVVLRAENPAYKDLIYVNDDISKIRVLGKAVAAQIGIK